MGGFGFLSFFLCFLFVSFGFGRYPLSVKGCAHPNSLSFFQRLFDSVERGFLFSLLNLLQWCHDRFS